MDKFLKNKAITKIALSIYWVVLTFLLLKPAKLEAEPWYIFPNVDKVIHLSVFALLAFLFLLVFSKIKFSVFIQIMLIYAFITEIMQEIMKMGRSLETLDVLADFIGLCLGFYIYKFLSKAYF